MSDVASGIRDIHLSRNALLAVVTVIGIAAIGLVVYFLIADGDEKGKKEQQNEQTQERPNRPPLRKPGENVRNTDAAPIYPAPGPAQTKAVTDAARGFTDAWLRTDRDKDAWLKGVEPYGTTAFTQQLATIDPADVPATSREGEPREISSISGFSAVTVPLNSGTLRLEFRYIDDKWLIASYGFELRAP